MNFAMFFDPYGRMDRGQFSTAVLVMVVLGSINASSGFVTDGIASLLLGILSFFISLLLAYMWVAIWVKRLHNAGTSGWMTLLIILGWFILFTTMSGFMVLQAVPELLQMGSPDANPDALAAAMEERLPSLTAPLIAADAVLSVVFALGLNFLLPNSKEENQYGPAV